ncbi:hypothetical protein [Phycicoccus sp. SLBN-51]|uniref:hypothetical protein n=1 Tax=Phycicoccus sp. SLBN-51 TaxID=2768447 RepID=UPI00115221FC|nr:hypothetical protein [Phycicoccus sp. SLBN-51]TQJ49716.1 hypothetical protein FBY26_1407 [Phycicoccus sp. SLBN-51]
MTEPADPTVEQPHVNVTALFAEAAGKSGLLWVDVPGDRAWPAWHVWADDTVFIVSGPGEQTLPWLPDEVTLIVRSKDTGGRLLTVHATVRALSPDDPQWETATEALKGSRLNATDDLLTRWSTECTVRALRPYGTPLEAPGHYRDTSGAAPVPPSEATTTGWRPWHLGGRPLRRRGTRLPDDRGGAG